VVTLGAGVPALLAKDAGRLGVKALFKNGSKAGRAAVKQSSRATRAARSQLDNLGSKTRKLRRSPNEATETTTRALRCGCFTAGTQVVMADGVARAIDQVETGDTVVGRDGAMVGKIQDLVVCDSCCRCGGGFSRSVTTQQE
jgi:hypothetical protein